MFTSGAHPHTTGRDVFVLSGGAARGAVHVGMMQTLLEAGIVPDALVGTSVGALNATFVGWHTSLDRVHELADHWLQLTSRDIFPGGTWTRLAHLAQRRTYLYSSHGLRNLITTWMPVSRLEELTTPVRVTTTPLAGHGAAYHDRGDLLSVLLASTAVPGVFAPVHLEGQDGSRMLHVDGGIADLCPSPELPTSRPPGCSCSTRACRPGCRTDARRSTCWSPASESRCEPGRRPTSARTSRCTTCPHPTSARR